MFVPSRTFSKFSNKDQRPSEHVCLHPRKNQHFTLHRQTKALKSTAVAFVVLVIFLWLISLVYKWQTYERGDVKAGSAFPNYFYRIRNKSVFEQSARITARGKRPHYSEAELIQMESSLNDRRAHLREYCESVQAKSDNLENVLSNIILDEEHGVAWCPIYKVASTSWMWKFAALGGALTDTTIELVRQDVLQVNNIVRQIYPREPDLDKVYQKLNQTKTFLIVRDPFERLVSAYRDKLEKMKGREYYYKRFGRHIAHRYRRFREANDTRMEPTFTEFLQFIIEEKYFDEHWAPFFDTCQPCSISYDYILKFDTLERDQYLLIRDLNLGPFLPEEFKLKSENETESEKSRGPTTSAVVEEYKRNVPKELLRKIYKVYQHDFQAFSYQSLCE